MKKIFLILFLFIIPISSFAQTTHFPAIDKRTQKDLAIVSIENTSSYTQINFMYRNSTATGHYIYFTNSGRGAFYLKANGTKYNLLSTSEIGNKDGVTAAYPNKAVYFSARFEKLPSYTTVLDFVQDVNSSWNMYGIHLKNNTSSSSNQQTETSEKFRNDYNNVAIYNKATEEWSDWIKADHTFILNYNSRNDVMHMKANGDNFVYKKMTEVEEGSNDKGQKYQSFSALDEEGIRFTLILYYDKKVGLMMIYSDVKIQFAYF